MPIYEAVTTCPKCGGDGKVDIHIPAVPASDSHPAVPEHDVTEECRLCVGKGWLLENYYEGAVEVDALQEDVTKCLHRLKKIMNKLDIEDEE